MCRFQRLALLIGGIPCELGRLHHIALLLLNGNQLSGTNVFYFVMQVLRAQLSGIDFSLPSLFASSPPADEPCHVYWDPNMKVREHRVHAYEWLKKAFAKSSPQGHRDQFQYRCNLSGESWRRKSEGDGK